MITNERFIREINDEMHEETGVPNAYQKFCGKLRLEDIFTTDTIYISACHCALGFKNRGDTMAFMQSPWLNSYRLARDVREGRFKPKYYMTKQIVERGKPRTIRPPVFECKVVQKTLCDYVLRTLLEPRMIKSNYASIRGRGTKKCYEDMALLKSSTMEFSVPVVPS